MSRYCAELTDFGDPAEDKHIVAKTFVLEATSDGVNWDVLPPDQFSLYKKDGLLDRRLVDDADSIVDWQDYMDWQDLGNQAFRASYEVVDGTDKTPLTEVPVTFAEADSSVVTTTELNYAMENGYPNGQKIAKWDIGVEDAYTLSADDGNVKLNSVTPYISLGSATAFATGVGIWQGKDSGVYKWRVGDPAGNKAEWDNSTFNIVGTITATGGTISGNLLVTGTLQSSATANLGYKLSSTGFRTWNSSNVQTAELNANGSGWLGASTTFAWTTAGTVTLAGFTAGSDYLKDNADTFGLASTVTGGNDVRFWAGASFASRASAPLQIYEDGFIFAKDIVLAKGSLSGASGATGYGYAVDPLLLTHFDGPAPFASDFKGSAIGHKGQVDTRTGGVIFRQGIFNKAVQVAEATTNLALNPSAETTGNHAARGTATVTRDTATYLLGATSYKVVLAAANDGIDLTTSALANAVHYVGFWATGSALSTLQVSTNGSNWNAITQLATQVSNGVTWTLCGVSILAAQANGSTTTRLRNTASSGTFYIDCVQVEQRAYPTPYCDGTLGDGHSWSGTAHASTSARTAATLDYAPSGNINLAQGTISFWTFALGVSDGFPVVLSAEVDSNNRLTVLLSSSGSLKPYCDALSGGATVSTASGATAQNAGWNHIAVTWTAGALKLYLNGVQSGATGVYVAPVGTLAALKVGYGLTAFQANTRIDDLAILPVVLTDHEIKAIYYSSAPLMLGVSNQELRLSGPGLGEVFGNANGLFGRAADGTPSFGLFNGTVNTNTFGGASESLTSGSMMLGNNNASKANMVYDASTGRLNFRAGTATNLYISTAGALTFVADAGSYAKWVTGSATLGEMWAGASGGFGTLVIIGRGKDATDTTGVVKLQANKHNDASTSNLAVASYGSATLTGVDGVASQLSTLYTRDFGGGTTVQGTTTETTIYSATINGNAMSSQGILTVELGGDLKNNSGLTPNLTLRVKFGGTTVCTLKVSNITSFSGVGGYVLRARIANDGNTNAQRAFASLIASKNGTWDGTSADYGSAAIDTTSNVTLLVTAQWSTAAGSPEAPGVFSKGGLVEIQRTN